jgi:acetyl-CoA acetyltransferase
MTIGILAAGAYIPRLQLSRRVIAETNRWLNSALMSQAKGERAICNWDEDTVTMAVEGGAIRGVLDGFYDANGTIPCQIDGGLKCFGHPIGASGLRMIYELYLQMLDRAGERQRKNLPRVGLTHNLGGFPHQNVCSISIVGRYGV